MNEVQIKRFDFLAILTASLTFVVSQSWNSFIQNSINKSFPDENKSLSLQFLYTTSITILAGIIIYIIFNYSDYVNEFLSNIKFNM
jgi:hypothetical protein